MSPRSARLSVTSALVLAALAAASPLTHLGAGAGVTPRTATVPTRAGGPVRQPSGRAAAAATLEPPTLVNPTTLTVTHANTTLTLSPGKDYVVKLPTTSAPLADGVSIIGGRNVVVDGGIISVPAAPAHEAADEDDRRGLYLKNQTGTVYVHGVHLTGPLSEGIDLSEPGTTTVVELSDLVVDTVSGYTKQHHPDVLQTWAGPSKLLVDGLTGSTAYQGLFLLPNQDYSGPAPRLFSLENVQISTPAGAYAFWRTSGASFPLELSNVSAYIGTTRASSRDLLFWPKPSTGDRSWDEVSLTRAKQAPVVVATTTGAAAA